METDLKHHYMDGERGFTALQPTGTRKWPGVTVSTRWGEEQEDTGAKWDTCTVGIDTVYAADFYTRVLLLAYKEALLFQMQSHEWIRKLKKEW